MFDTAQHKRMTSSPELYRTIIKACRDHDTERFRSFIEMLHMKKNLKLDTYVTGNTIAHYCYEYGFIEGAEILNSLGDKNTTHAVNSLNETPLHIACEYQQYDMVRWHLEHNDRPEDYKVGDHRSGYTPSMWLVTYGNVPLLHSFAQRNYIDKDHRTTFSRNTHFTLAICKNQPDVVLYLFKHGLIAENIRPESSVIKELIMGNRDPRRMLNVLKRINMLTEVDLDAHVGYYIMNEKVTVFVYLVREGLIRNTDDLLVFQNMRDAHVQLFIDGIDTELKLYDNFVRGFLVATVQTYSQQDFTRKHRLLHSFTPNINQSIAEYADVPYGSALTQLRTMFDFINSFA
jgi:hypothetical protein